MPRKATVAPPKKTQQVFRVIARGRAFRPHEDLYHLLLVRPWWAFLLITGSLYILTCFVFAALYLLQPGSIANARPGSFEDAFFFSVQTMSTVGYGGLAPATRWANLLVTVQAVVGIMQVALFTGITFAKFSQPTARVLFTDKAVVMTRDGLPHLMVRMANWRHNQVVEAHVKMFVVVPERTREGDIIRRPMELKLVRDNTPIFTLTFTAMHPIDGSSPFSDPAKVEAMRQDKVDLIVAFDGLDQTRGQQIYTRYAYAMDDIIWNAQFKDVLQIQPDGTREVDYTNFHEIVEFEKLPN
jgi:inward rectifier potassium channel